MFAINEVSLGFVNQRGYYRRLQNVGVKLTKNVVNKYEGIWFANRYKIPYSVVKKKSYAF